jgi:D-alanine-D-alanine ligase-like ATP-grasp enzyme
MAAPFLLRLGKRQRALVSQFDVARSTGVRYARLRRREAAELRAQGGEPRNSVYREIWEDAASAAGAEYEQLSEDFAEMRRDGVRTRVKRQATELDAEVTLDIASHKGLVHGWLTDAGIPVPEHSAFGYGDLDEGLAFLEATGAPCVIKPGSGSGGGWGLAGNVRTRDQLARAVLNASRYSPEILIERQVEGDLHRVLVLDGEVIDVVRRRSPSVEGDGESTVRELIAAENRRRLDARGHAGLWPLRIDLDCLFALEARGESLDAVPPSGATVTVKHVTNENRLEDNVTVPAAEVGEGIREDARKAAELVGLRLAGLDVIATDLARSLAESGGVVLEVNGAPGLSHHYHVADRAKATPVARPILEKLLSRPKETNSS